MWHLHNVQVLMYPTPPLLCMTKVQCVACIRARLRSASLVPASALRQPGRTREGGGRAGRAWSALPCHRALVSDLWTHDGWCGDDGTGNSQDGPVRAQSPDTRPASHEPG